MREALASTIAIRRLVAAEAHSVAEIIAMFPERPPNVVRVIISRERRSLRMPHLPGGVRPKSLVPVLLDEPAFEQLRVEAEDAGLEVATFAKELLLRGLADLANAA